MMRRSRISVKPNVRSGNRTGTIGEQVCEAERGGGDPLPVDEAVEVVRPAPFHQQTVAINNPSENLAIVDVPGTPSGLNLNDGAPSSGVATSSAPSRRMRILATPKLGPKHTSTPRTQTKCQARMPILAPAPIPNEEHVQIKNSSSQVSVSIISNELPESGSPRRSTSTTNLPAKCLEMTNTSSLCAPSTSGLQKSTVHGKNSMEDSPPSPQPGQVPLKPSQEPEPPGCLSSSDLSSTCITPSQFDKTGSSEKTEKSSDKDRILRALKLKELMKIERRKDLKMKKRTVGHKEYTALDRSKMTMRDLIYFLPNTSPMRSSEERVENQAETIIPPSPRQQIKTAERDDEDEEESDNEEMLVPKVRVAEDGSIILDEESLSVRVQRTSNTKVLEGSMALFERGSTTTYTSFRTTNHVKSWSVRETDLFFLAISMVGTDFTLVGQLLSHRSRIAIKNKFKKEERLNPWRVDKALRNKRPYDKEFFSYLLEKILAKDKDKRKSVKLILPKTKKQRKSKGKTSHGICISDDNAGDDDVFSVDDYGDLADDADLLVEKENEDVSNVKEENPSVPAKKRCKRTRDVHKDKDKSNSVEKQVKRKRQRKCSKNTSEVHSKEDTEGLSSLSVEGDTINLDKEDELARSTSASKRRRKSSKSSEEKQTEKPTKEKKAKQRKKSRKVVSDHEESVGEHEEGSIVDENGSAIKKKRKQAKNSDLNGDEAGKGKKNRKRKKAQKSTVQEEGTAEGESSLDLQEAKECNAPDTAEVPPKTTRRSKKLLTNLAATRKKKCNKPEAAADIKTESQYENNHESILTAAGSPVQDERLQMQAAVVLEKTPPRQLNSLSPSKVQCKNQDLEPSMSSNASSSSIECSTQQTRKQRAGRVKRDLSTSGKLGSREKMIDQDVAEPVSTMGLLEQIIQESENPEEDNSMNENLIDLSCLPDLDSQMFQRRPMVVLSREEVDMVFHAPDHSDDEDPSVSPLDLSLNTELSFPLQCSKLLMDDEEAEVEDCVFEENEERTNERASCEERTYEDLELTESAQAQPDISNIRDIPSCLKSEVCSQPEVGPSKVTTSCSMEETKPHLHPMACKDGTTALESSPPLVDDNVDPFCKNPDTPMAQETTTSEPISHGTSLVISNVMEQSEKYMPPILPKESAPASSEITPYSKPTPIESELGSLRSLQATQEPKEELQTSLEGQTWDTLHDLSENIKGTQESLIASPEVKVRMQGCAVAPELKEDFQEDVSVQASSAAGSSELCIKPTRRSRILKPKPNLSQKSRGPALLSQRRNLKTHSTFEPKSSQPSVSTERLPHSPATDQHNAFEDISMQKLNKDVETSQSHAMDQMESESVPDLSDSSTAVPDLQSVAAVTQNPASTDEPHVASECSSSKFVGYVGKIPPCTSLPFPPPSQTREDTGVGQMIVPSEDVCAPAEILQLTEDGHNGEEPTFILTLYEIPVKQTYLPSSSNDCVMALDLPTVEKQASLGFSDQTHILSTSESFRTDSMPMEGSGTEKVYLQNDLGVITKDLAESSKEQISAHTSPEILSPQTKDEGTSVNLHSGSECTETLPQDHVDTQQCETVSHLVPGDLVVPVSEKAVKSKLHSKEDSTVSLPERQDTPCEELAKVGDLSAVSNPLCLDSTEKSKDVPLSSEKKKAPARRRERLVKPQPKLVKRAHAKVEESSPQTTTQIVLPSSHQGNLASISNTTDEKSVESISSIEGNMTSVSKGKELKPKSTAEESPKMSQGDLDLESKHISSALQLCRNPKLEEESRGNIPGHTIIKDDMKSSAEDKELSMAMPNEGAIVQPCCEDRRYSLMKASGSSTVDSEKTEAESDWSLENSLPRAGEHFQKELKIENVSQTLIEDSPQSPLMDNNSPVKKSGKQEVKRACSKNDPTETMLSLQTSPDAASPQLTNLPPNENMVLLEEQLQRKHHIMPCTVHLSSLDTADWSLKPPQCEDLHRHNESTVMSSQSVTNISEASCIPSLSEEMKLEEPELEKKSPTRSKGTKNESSTDRKCGHSNPLQTISQTRQLTITDWVKRKLHQTAANQEEKESEKSLQMHTRLKAKDVHQLLPEKTLLKSEHAEELEGSHLAPTLDENKEVKKSSEMVKESAEIPSVSQVKKSPARRRAKLQVKPILNKRARIRSEGETSTADQPQPSRFASSTRQSAQTAREKQESDHEAIPPVKEDLNISSMKADSKSAEASLITSGSPISQDTWPRVVLPRVKLCTTEAGVCLPSTSTVSPVRDSQSAPQSVTPLQLKKSPMQRSSPTANENPDNDPARVSQFFLCDIFTEVDE